MANLRKVSLLQTSEKTSYPRRTLPRHLAVNSLLDLQMIYLMQDAVSSESQHILNVNIKRGISSVYGFLEEKGGLAVLNDPLVEIATREILANGRPRPQITRDIRRKVCVIGHGVSAPIRACCWLVFSCGGPCAPLRLE